MNARQSIAAMHETNSDHPMYCSACKTQENLSWQRKYKYQKQVSEYLSVPVTPQTRPKQRPETSLTSKRLQRATLGRCWTSRALCTSSGRTSPSKIAEKKKKKKVTRAHTTVSQRDIWRRLFRKSLLQEDAISYGHEILGKSATSAHRQEDIFLLLVRPPQHVAAGLSHGPEKVPLPIIHAWRRFLVSHILSAEVKKRAPKYAEVLQSR